jgi:hypothetical protein
MPKVVLLPDLNIAPNWSEIIGKTFEADRPLPEPWQPRLELVNTLDKVEAFAFPTPFAWAEMMAAVLRQGLYDHLLFKFYEDLVLGLVLGHLQLEVSDLKGFEFGKILAGTDDRYRYFGLLRAHPRHSELQGKVFGATSSEALFWPSARRTDADWRKLREAYTTDVRLNDAYQVLADLRDLLSLQKLWQVVEVPWIKGLNHIIADHKPSDGHKHFHVHSRLVGPVLAKMPGDRQQPFYFPVYENQFVSDFLRALTGSFKQEEGRIVILDDKQRRHYEIRMPTVPSDGDILLAGAGTIRSLDEPGKIKEFQFNRVRLEKDEKGEGLTYLLQPLDEALRRPQPQYPALGKDVTAIKQRPFFYPDIIRIPVARLGQAGVPEQVVSFSDRAYKLAFESSGTGLPLLSELSSQPETHQFILPHTHAGKTTQVIYIEEYGGHPVGDLRALGWVLWSYFIGTAELQGDKLRDTELTPLLKATSTGRLFDLAEEAYRRVVEERSTHRRLATLQRFLRAYTERGSASGASDVDRLCQAAAQTFVKWIWPEQKVLENGRVDRSLGQTLPLEGANIYLAKDARSGN